MSSKKFVKSLITNNQPILKDLVSNDDTLDLLLESLAFAYKGDTTKPGVLVSKVNKGSRIYYASVLRFSNGSKERTVVVSATGRSKDEAIEGLALKWVKLQKPTTNPVDELKIFLGI